MHEKKNETKISLKEGSGPSAFIVGNLSHKSQERN